MAVTVSWRESGVVVQEPVDFGNLQALDTSATKTLNISHDSRQAIVQCGLFISPILEDYEGSRYAQFDYDQIIKYGTEYPGKGLAVRQQFLATGIIDEYAGDRLVDFEREETTDIFTQASLPSIVSPVQVEILDGTSVGETAEVTAYDPQNSLFTLATPFTTDVTGAQYQMQIETLDYVRHQVGTAEEFPILLLNQAGVIPRNESVDIELFMDVPKFSFAASKLLVNFNLTFFSTDIE